MKKNRIISLLLLALMAATSCGGTGSGTNDDTSADNSTSAADTDTGTTAPEYVFADIDCGGDNFTVLNATTTWGFYAYMDFETQTGESLDDAVYERNRFVEEKYNIKLEIVEDDIDKNYEKYRSSILAGDDTYDTAYIRCDRIASFIADGYLTNLLDNTGI